MNRLRTTAASRKQELVGLPPHLHRGRNRLRRQQRLLRRGAFPFPGTWDGGGMVGEVAQGGELQWRMCPYLSIMIGKAPISSDPGILYQSPERPTASTKKGEYPVLPSFMVNMRTEESEDRTHCLNVSRLQ